MVIGGIQKVSLVDYPGKTSAVLFTVGCNMRCGYCHNPGLVLPKRFGEPLGIDDVCGFLKQRQGKLDAVVISGGEPTVHDDLPELAGYIKELGYLLKLDSNGANPDMLATMIDRRLVDYIAMDIKGPLSKYAAIVSRSVDTSAISRSIKLILSSGLPHEFRTTIVKTQLLPEDFAEIGRMIKGAERYALQKFVPTKTLNPQLALQQPYSDDEMERLKQIIQEYVTTCVIH